MKIYNLLNSVFYILYGLFGAFVPTSMAKLMGWTPDLLGLHQIRATSMAMAAMGLAAFISTRKSSDQTQLALVFITLTMALAAGRFLGLIFDGHGPTQTYGEIAFEITWSIVGVLLLKRRMWGI